MIPSDHFVKFYNEIFKYLDGRGQDALDRYYARVADRQAYFTLDRFRKDGLKGMYDYWERIRVEENCELVHDFHDDFYHLKMTMCPSLSKVTDNDAGPCPKYCDHCPGWVGRVIAMAGFWMVYDLVGRTTPQCEFWVFKSREDAEAKRAELAALRGDDLVKTNFDLVQTQNQPTRKGNG
jgi:hypothetical protein